MWHGIRNFEKGVKESEQQGRDSHQNSCVLSREAASDNETKGPSNGSKPHRKDHT
jgi:hypothetical protein